MGFGAFLLLLGFVLYIRQGWYAADWSEFIGRICLCSGALFPLDFGESNLHTVTFGMFFYGLIYFAVGVSILAVRYFGI